MRHLGIAFPAHATVANLHHRARAFWPARQAIAAAEFALVLPLFVTLMLGSVEVARLITFARKVTLVATTAVEMLSQKRDGNGQLYRSGFRHRFNHGDLSADLAGRGTEKNFVEQ